MTRPKEISNMSHAHGFTRVYTRTTDNGYNTIARIRYVSISRPITYVMYKSRAFFTARGKNSRVRGEEEKAGGKVGEGYLEKVRNRRSRRPGSRPEESRRDALSAGHSRDGGSSFLMSSRARFATDGRPRSVVVHEVTFDVTYVVAAAKMGTIPVDRRTKVMMGIIFRV